MRITAQQIINECEYDPFLTDLVLQSAGDSDLGNAAIMMEANPAEYYALKSYTLTGPDDDVRDLEPLPSW